MQCHLLWHLVCVAHQQQLMRLSILDCIKFILLKMLKMDSKARHSSNLNRMNRITTVQLQRLIPLNSNFSASVKENAVKLSLSVWVFASLKNIYKLTTITTRWNLLLPQGKQAPFNSIRLLTQITKCNFWEGSLSVAIQTTFKVIHAANRR